MDGELPRREDLGLVFDELDYQMACQVYLWALPLVSYAQWQHAAPRRVRGDELRPRPLRQLPRPARADHGQRDHAVHPELLRPGRDRAAGHRAAAGPDRRRRVGLLAARDRRDGRDGPGPRPGRQAPDRAARAATPPDVDDGYYVLRSTGHEHHVRVPHPRPRPGSAPQALVDAVRIYPYAERDDPPPTRDRLARTGGAWTGDQPRGLDYWERLHEHLPARDRRRARPLLPRHAQAARHREGQAVRARRAADGDPRPRPPPPAS